MLEVIKQLLRLQERDRKILQVQSELADLGPQRRVLEAKAAQAQSALESGRSRFQHLEAQRKEAELEVESLNQRIEKYSLQQFQTKKNDEYRALAHEIETCRKTILQLEDKELELMEQIEGIQREITQAAQTARDAKELVETKLAQLAEREQHLKQQAVELQAGREQLAGAVDESARLRYERLLKHKGEKVIVGIDHGVCAGCHMTLPTHLLIACQSDQEIVSCSNCGRLLYYSLEMDLSSNDR